jgi:hypothetical protein
MAMAAETPHTAPCRHLDIELDPEARIEPARQADEVRDRQAEHERHQRRLEVIGARLIPLADRKNDDRENVEEDEGGHEVAQFLPKRDDRDGEDRQPQQELNDIARYVGGEVGA